MTLNDRINEDLRSAMKAGEKTKLETLRTLRAHLIELAKRGTGKGITEEDELTVLTAALKKRKEAIEMYQKAGRQDLVDQEQEELEIIQTYLPKQLSTNEAEKIIEGLMKETGATTIRDFGKVMPLAIKQLKGRIDGRVVQELVRNKLGEHHDT